MSCTSNITPHTLFYDRLSNSSFIHFKNQSLHQQLASNVQFVFEATCSRIPARERANPESEYVAEGKKNREKKKCRMEGMDVYQNIYEELTLWMLCPPPSRGRSSSLHVSARTFRRACASLSCVYPACLRRDVATQVGMQFRNARVAHEASSPSPSEGLLTGRNRPRPRGSSRLPGRNSLEFP